MKSSQLKAGTVLSYSQMVLNILVGLFYTPVMLQLLGQAEYGLYNTVSSTISMLSILSLGFNSSYIRYFARYKAVRDDRSIQNLNGLFLLVFSFIGLAALLCGLFLSFHLELVFDQGLTDAEYRTARVLMLMLTVSLAVSFPMSTFTSIISAHERYVFLKLVGILKTVISPLMTLPLLLLGYRSVAMVVVTLVVSFLTDIIYICYAGKVLKVKFTFRKVQKGILTDLLLYSSLIAINMAVDQINNNMDKFLLGRFMGTEAVAVYAVGFTLYHYYLSFSMGISSVFSPRIHKIVNATVGDMVRQKVQLTDMLVRVGRVQFLILALISSGVILFGREFIAIWAGDGYEDAYYVALLLMIPSTVPLIQNVGIEVQRAINRHGFRSICYLIMAAINLVCSIYLCQRYGAVGCAAGTAMSFVIGNGLIMNLYYHKRCNLDMICFWKQILRLVPGLVVPIAAGCVMKSLWRFDTFLAFAAGVLVYTCIYGGSMWLFGMDSYEKGLITGSLRKITGRENTEMGS